MTHPGDETIRRMAAEDPAAGSTIDAQAREQTWRIVAAAVSASAERPARTPLHPHMPGARRFVRTPLVVVAALLVVAGAAYASGLFPVGEPAKTVEQFESPSSAFGAVVPASVRVLPLSTPDPAGGPPWGLRVFTTTRGAGCIQVGRLVGGQIGALGEDGAFGDDGRFHALPVASTNPVSCAALDADGRIFQTISKSFAHENALEGPERAPSRQAPHPHEICVSQVATAFERSAVEGRVCPLSQERNLYYGLLGPDASSITYSVDGRDVTVPTEGPDGAYLIVTGAADGRAQDAFGGGAAGVVPLDGPISEIHYSDGSVCRLTGRSTPVGSCTSAISEPVGYMPVAPPAASQVAAPLSVTLAASAAGGEQAQVAFSSPVAVDGLRSQYKIQWRQPAGSSRLAGETASREGASPHQPVTLHTERLAPGSAEVLVTLQYASGPELLEGPGTIEIPVGTATVTVP